MPGPGGYLLPEGDACSGGCLVAGVCMVWGKGLPGETPPPDGYCCGRYASYWNAFLFNSILSLFDSFGKL